MTKRKTFFKVGDELECLQYVIRQDRMSAIKPGDIVKVVQAYTFKIKGVKHQDITVQRRRNHPISVLVAPGRFALVKNK